MNCEQFKNLIVDYLYEELSDEDAALFQQHKKKCRACRDELKALEATSHSLRQWQDEEPKLNMVFVKEKSSFLSSTFGGLWEASSRIRRIGIGFAAACAAVLFLLSLFNTQVSYKEGDFDARFSLFQASSSSKEESTPLTPAEFTELQRSQFALIDQLIKESEDRQRREMAITLTNLTRNIDQQRKTDLRLLGQGLEAVQYRADRRISRTDRVLNELIRLTSSDDIAP